MNIIEIVRRFNTQRKCIRHLEFIRWHGKVLCPYCSSNRTTALKRENRHHCNGCNKSFSVLVGTIFEDTHLELPKWFVAIGLILNAKKGISSRQLSRDIEVNKNTAWYVQMRIRKAMNEDNLLLTGVVEIDETYVGGALRNKTKKHRIAQKEAGKTTTGMEHKKPILGLLQRSGKVITRVLTKANGDTIKPIIDQKVEQDTTIITDGFGGYAGLEKKYKEHQIVNHEKDEFVRGIYHTNTIEGFWSLVKRAIIGQYHKVSGRYLHLYVNECGYKYNNRNNPALFSGFMMDALTTNSI